MFSSRPNPIIKYYLKNKSLSPERIAKEPTYFCLRGIDNEENNFISPMEKHRQHIISDFQKKVEQIKNLKIKVNHQNATYKKQAYMIVRAKTYRNSLNKTNSLTQSRVFKSTQIRGNKDDRMVKSNIMEFSTIRNRQNTEPIVSKPLTPFQKTTMKRLRARQQITLKKKFISINMDYRKMENSKAKTSKLISSSFRTFTTNFD